MHKLFKEGEDLTEFCEVMKFTKKSGVLVNEDDGYLFIIPRDDLSEGYYVISGGYINYEKELCICSKYTNYSKPTADDMIKWMASHNMEQIPQRFCRVTNTLWGIWILEMVDEGSPWCYHYDKTLFKADEHGLKNDPYYIDNPVSEVKPSDMHFDEDEAKKIAEWVYYSRERFFDELTCERIDQLKEAMDCANYENMVATDRFLIKYTDNTNPEEFDGIDIYGILKTGKVFSISSDMEFDDRVLWTILLEGIIREKEEESWTVLR